MLHVLDRLLPSGPVVIGIDDTIERRWGAKIKARGIYRDPVRSSKGHFVKTSGLRWLSLMVVAPITWKESQISLPNRCWSSISKRLCELIACSKRRAPTHCKSWKRAASVWHTRAGMRDNALLRWRRPTLRGKRRLRRRGLQDIAV